MLLFDFFKTPKQVEQSGSVLAQSQLSQDHLDRQLRAELTQTWDNIGQAQSKVILTDGNLTRAEKVLQLYADRSLSYTANSRELLDAEQAALQAKINKLDAELDFYLQYLAAKHLTGETLL
jgi:outer membrane protein TolC